MTTAPSPAETRQIPELTPAWPVDQFSNRLLPFPLEVPAFHTYLYWHANAEADPANVWLRQQLVLSLRDSAFSAHRMR